LRELQRLSWILVAFLAAVPIAERIARAAETAAINEEAVDRMIDLNKKAFADIQSSRFDAARYRLEEALVIGETAGLEKDEITARTYVHLAVVYLTGFKNRDEAVTQFMTGLKLDPNITITVGLETPALKSAYLLARKRMGLPPNPDTLPAESTLPSASGPEVGPAMELVVTATSPVAENTAVTEQSRGSAAGSKEPDPPARIQAPLYCPLPFEIPAGQDLVVRCLTRRPQKKSSATFYYRREGATGDDYSALTMDHSPKGWLVGTIPGDAIRGRSLSYYIQAQIAGSPETLSWGRPDAPNAFIVKEDAESDASTSSRAGRARAAQTRQRGAAWIAVASGAGAAFHGRQSVDSGAPAAVHAGFSPAGLLQIEPEVGYQWNEKLSVSVMARYQYAPKDADAYAPRPGERDILTSALAGFVRAQFGFLTHDHFQPHASGGLGIGDSFLVNVRKQCSDSSCTLNHSDTLHGGPVGLILGIGAIFPVSPTFGVFVDVNEIATLPRFMALTEVNLGVTVTFNRKERTMSRKPSNAGL
jgi:hypothetical protein